MILSVNILEKPRNSLWPQWLAAFEVCLLNLMVGMNMGWISPFVAQLSSPNPPYKATKEEIVWVASLVNLTRAVGTIAGSVITFQKGSKLAIYLCGFCFLTSWTCLIFANTIKMVFISLVSNGVSQGAISAIFPLYIGEIAHPQVRGKLVSFIVQGVMTGTLLGNITGAYLPPWQYAAINFVISAFFVITFSFFPHTPHYLVRCKNIKGAAKAIRWYNRSADVPKELASLSDFLAKNPKLTFLETLRKLNTPVNRKILLMMNVAYSVAHLTGIAAIQSYMEVLLTEARITIIAPSSVVIIFGVINIISVWVAIFNINKFGRTTILLVTCIFMAIGLLGWGLSYHLFDLGFGNPKQQWIPIIFGVLYRINLVIGILTVVPTLLSEIFAPDVKYMAVCICNISNALFAFITNRYFQAMVDALTYYYVFYLFAGCSVCMGIYCKIVIPETNRKSLAEIQAMLNKDEFKKLQEITKL